MPSHQTTAILLLNAGHNPPYLLSKCQWRDLRTFDLLSKKVDQATLSNAVGVMPSCVPPPEGTLQTPRLLHLTLLCLSQAHFPP